MDQKHHLIWMKYRTVTNKWARFIFKWGFDKKGVLKKGQSNFGVVFVNI